jgi:hypothetical protein
VYEYFKQSTYSIGSCTSAMPVVHCVELSSAFLLLTYKKHDTKDHVLSKNQLTEYIRGGETISHLLVHRSPL